MYIHPFALGVMATLAAEFMIVLIAFGITEYKEKKDGNHKNKEK